MPLRDRVLELRRVPAALLRPHPRNWRTHPEPQAAALRALLAEIGLAGALLARPLADGTFELIDGHLRAEIVPDQPLPVLVLDVTEEEAAKILTTYDAVGAMAEADIERLQGLLAEMDTDNPALTPLFDPLLTHCDATPAPSARGSGASAMGGELPESYQLVVHCADEETQEDLYEELINRGYRCRVLSM